MVPTRNSDSSSDLIDSQPLSSALEALEEELSRIQVTVLPYQHFFEDIDSQMEAPMQPLASYFLGETATAVDTETSRIREVKQNRLQERERT